MCARAFELFADGHDCIDVVRELRRPIAEVRELRAAFFEERDRALLLTGRERRALETVAGRELRTGADVLSFVARVVRALRERNGSARPS